jgi:hypothetical protein
MIKFEGNLILKQIKSKAMNTRSVFYIILLALASSVLFGCETSKRASGSSPAYRSNTSYDGTYGKSSGTAGLASTQDWVDKNSETPDRKMIYNASISIVVKKPDTTNVYLAAIARKYKGYVLSTGSTYTTLRVKSDSLQLAIKEIAALGKVKYKNVYAEDITDEYANLQIRLENAQKARTRYLELLAKAITVEETLKVEKELERLNTEIDLLEGKMLRMDHLEEYSTINVSIQQKVKLGPLGFTFKYLYTGVKYLFVWN